MGTQYLIDTSAVIKYLNGTLPTKGITFLDDILDQESCISFITEIELQVWNPKNPDDLEIYKNFVDLSRVMGLEQKIIDLTIAIRKNYGLKLPDALIAATALTKKRILIADNDKDFRRVPQLKYVNPKVNSTLTS